MALLSYAFTGCGAVYFNAADAPTAAEETTAQETKTETKTDRTLDCDALMQSLADNCFNITAFDKDGKTPLHITDENGNDMGEVDQKWASAYCECYAQLAFQTFGCTEVSKHQELSDDEYDKIYAPIIASCTEQDLSEKTTDETQNGEAAPDQATVEPVSGETVENGDTGENDAAAPEQPTPDAPATAAVDESEKSQPSI